MIASTADQMQQLVGIAEREGLYDAADWLKNHLAYRRFVNADCRRCESEARAAMGSYYSGRMIVCRLCGDKRCPKASDHRNGCKLAVHNSVP